MHARTVHQQVAEIHASNIDQGFLSSLGPRFLALLYEAIDADENSFLLIEGQNERVTAFVSGTSSMSSIYRKLLARWPRLIWALLPAMVSPRKVSKIVELLLRKPTAAPNIDIPRAELLSLAVMPENRKGGQAQRLYRQLEKEMADRQISGFKIVVGDSLDAAHLFYKKMGATELVKTEIHKGQSSTVYFQKISVNAQQPSQR